MPELPDVEVFRRRLAEAGLDRAIEAVELPDARLLADRVSADRLRRTLTGDRFRHTHRHGKHLFLQLDGGAWLALHFGMTAYPLIVEADASDPDHVGARITFAGGGRLLYVTQRRLGELDLVDSPGDYAGKHGLGPDVLALGADGLRRLADRRKQAKCWLMDQATMAGLGNIYSDEVLFQARLHPKTPASDLTGAELDRLYARIEDVCEAAVKAGADPARMPASFLLPHRVDGGRCPRCDTALERVQACGRTAWYCPDCQPEADAR